MLQWSDLRGGFLGVTYDQWVINAKSVDSGAQSVIMNA